MRTPDDPPSPELRWRTRQQRGGSMSLFAELSPQQAAVEERLRTVALCTCGLGVVACALYYCRSFLVPLVLAVALTYTLQPMISCLSVRPILCCGATFCARKPDSRGVWRCLRPCYEACCLLQLPHWIAVILALSVAFATLGVLGFIVVHSVHTFASKAEAYTERVNEIVGTLSMKVDTMHHWISPSNTSFNTNAQNTTGLNLAINASIAQAPAHINLFASFTTKEFLERVPVTHMIVSTLSSLMEFLENLFLVLLLVIYLLASPSSAGRNDSEATAQDDQINAYIRGKVGISLLVGVLTSAALYVLGVDLWLVFGVLSFWLNFIPTVGAVIAVALPMPIVLLDTNFGPIHTVLALVLPGMVHVIVGHVIEPMLFGHSLKLSPVVVVLSLLAWGALWGVTGMVLAVPITAVLRIRLAHIEHPLPQLVVGYLDGSAGYSHNTEPFELDGAADEADEEMTVLPPGIEVTENSISKTPSSLCEFDDRVEADDEEVALITHDSMTVTRRRSVNDSPGC